MADFQRVQVNANNAADIKDTAAQYAPSNKPAPMAPTARETGQTARIVFRSGQQASFAEQGVQKSSANADVAVPNDLAGQPVIGRTGMNRPLTSSELRRDSIIDLPGGDRTSLAAAIACGFVTQNEHGQYVYAGNKGTKPSFKSAADSTTEGHVEPAANQTEDATEADTSEATDQGDNASSFDRAAGEALGEVVTKMPEGEVRSLSRDMIENGQLSPEAIALAAQRLGVTPEEATARASSIHGAFYRQASETIGPHAEDVFSFARTNAPADLRRAVEDHVNSGSLKGYAALNQKFMESLDTLHPELLLQSDATKAMNVRREQNGTISIDVPNVGRVSWRVAIRSGLIPMPYFTSNPFRRG